MKKRIVACLLCQILLFLNISPAMSAKAEAETDNLVVVSDGTGTSIVETETAETEVAEAAETEAVKAEAVIKTEGMDWKWKTEKRCRMRWTD